MVKEEDFKDGAFYWVLLEGSLAVYPAQCCFVTYTEPEEPVFYIPAIEKPLFPGKSVKSVIGEINPPKIEFEIKVVE